MNAKNLLSLPSALRALAPGLALGLLTACGGDDPEPEPECQPGTFCSCTLPTDCPTGETCTNGFCVTASVDTGDVDAGETSPDVEVDVTPDTTDVADVPDDVPTELDTTPDGDTSPDVTDAETSEDAETGTDGGEDAEVDTAEETGPDASGCGNLICDGVETCEDCPGDCGECPVDIVENPWVAYLTREVALERLVITDADGTAGAWRYQRSAACPTDPSMNFSCYERAPDWSYDGTRLAFMLYDSDTYGPTIQLMVLDFTGEGTATIIPHTFATITNPNWHPNGTEIFAEARETGATGNSIYAVNVGTGAWRRVTTPPAGDKDSSPYVSADGAYVYFIRVESGSDAGEVWRVAPAGGEPEEVTSRERIFGGVVADYSGDFLLFSPEPSDPDAPGELSLYSISGDSGSILGLPGDGDPDFFSDGERIALTRRPDGAASTEVCIVERSTGTIVERLTTNSAVEFGPAVANVESTDVDVSAFFIAP